MILGIIYYNIFVVFVVVLSLMNYDWWLARCCISKKIIHPFQVLYWRIKTFIPRDFRVSNAKKNVIDFFSKVIKRKNGLRLFPRKNNGKKEIV